MTENRVVALRHLRTSNPIEIVFATVTSSDSLSAIAVDGKTLRGKFRRLRRPQGGAHDQQSSSFFPSGVARMMTSIHGRKASACQPVAALRGRPPLAPLDRAAAAFLDDLVRPARRASSRAIQARLPKMPWTSPGT